MAMVCRAVQLYSGYLPRTTQLFALALFLNSENKGRIDNVSTGEGKSLITVMLATFLALARLRVDVITSSKVLAIRNSQERKLWTKEGFSGFFAMFNIGVSNNCDEECENPTSGETTEKYYSPANVIKISKYIKSIIGATHEMQVSFKAVSERLLTVDESVFCGFKQAIMAFLLGESSVVVDDCWEIMLKDHTNVARDDIVDGVTEIIRKGKRRELNPDEEGHLRNLVTLAGFNHVETFMQNTFAVAVPSTLMVLVEVNLKIWIEQAYVAKSISVDDNYIIGDAESNKDGEVIIMDKDTGVEQNSTKWCNGLHHFLQLKHSAKVSNESLKAGYISNMKYFTMQRTIYGMTGTVGGAVERKLVRDTYGVDFVFEIPRFKPYRFEYDAYSEYVNGTRAEWIQNIVNNIDENMDQRLRYTAKTKRRVNNDEVMPAETY